MADIIKISNSTVEFSLLLEADGFSMLASGNVFGVAETDNTYHEGSGASGSQLVESSVKNAMWPMKLSVGGDNNQDVLDNLSALEVMVRQARRYNTSKDVDQVYLYFKLDGCDVPTYYNVIDIKVAGVSLLDFYNRNMAEIVFSGGLSIEVETDPYGYGDIEILENFVSVADMEMNITNALIADDWTAQGVNGTYSMASAAYLVGTQSQYISAAAAGDCGIQSAVIDCSDYQSDSFIAYAWILVSAGNDVTVKVVDNLSAELATGKYSTATVTVKDFDDNVWSKVSISGSIGAASSTIQLIVTRESGDEGNVTLIYVDKTYLQFVATEPSAWCSCHKVYQHSDAEAGRSSHIDLIDIPGDAPALSKYQVDANDVGGNYGVQYIALRTDGESNIVGSEGFFNVTDGAYAGAIGDTSKTVEVSSDAWGTTIDTVLTGKFKSDARSLRVFISLRDDQSASSTAGDRVDVRLSYGFGHTEYTEAVKYPESTPNTFFHWLDMGTIDLRGEGYGDEDDIAISPSIIIDAKRDNAVGDSDIDLDYVLFFAADEHGLAVIDPRGGNDYVISSINNYDTGYLKSAVAVAPVYARLGAVPKFEPRVFQRVYVLFCHYDGNRQLNNESGPDYWSTVTLSYRARTKFLLGTMYGAGTLKGRWI